MGEGKVLDSGGNWLSATAKACNNHNIEALVNVTSFI